MHSPITPADEPHVRADTPRFGCSLAAVQLLLLLAFLLAIGSVATYMAIPGEPPRRSGPSEKVIVLGIVCFCVGSLATLLAIAAMIIAFASRRPTWGIGGLALTGLSAFTHPCLLSVLHAVWQNAPAALAPQPEPPLMGAQRVLSHRASVNGVCFAPNGQTLAAASNDRVLLWDPVSGASKGSLKGPGPVIAKIAFSPDAQTLAAAIDDNTIWLWDMTRKQRLAILRGHNSWITSLAYRNDSKLLASSSNDRTVRVWDVTAHTEVATLGPHRNPVHAVRFSPDGKLLAAGHGTQGLGPPGANKSGGLTFWDVATKTQTRNLEGFRGEVTQLAFTPDGGTLVLAEGESHAIKVLDVTMMQERATLTGHTASIWSLQLARNGTLVVSASSDSTVRIWSLAERKQLRSIAAHTDHVLALAVSPDGQTVASGGKDKAVRLWSLPAAADIRD